MNIALIGYGKMGRTISKIALSRKHNIGLIIDKENRNELDRDNLRGIDVAIEFTLPDQAFDNISRCLAAGVPVVSGTTGWLRQLDDARSLCEQSGTAFMYSSNFSIGVNILFHINRQLARIMDGYSDYSVGISEIHHSAKLDAPSGTAISLAEGIISSHGAYDSWTDEVTAGSDAILIQSAREGEVPGTHKVKWSSEIDEISLIHEAKGREGFALGAVLAAEYIKDKTGFRTISDMLGF